MRLTHVVVLRIALLRGVAALLAAAPLLVHAQAGANTDSAMMANNPLLNGPIRFTVPSLAGDSVKVGVGAPMTLLAVWATWCGPCQAEVPELNMLQREFGTRIRVLGLNMDKGNTKTVQAWLKKLGAEYPVARDANGAARMLGVLGVPAVYLINGTGHIEWKHGGAMLSSLPALRMKLKTLPPLAPTPQ